MGLRVVSRNRTDYVIAAHEGMHHRQTPRHLYGRRGARYVEVECDYAALRAARRMAGVS